VSRARAATSGAHTPLAILAILALVGLFVGLTTLAAPARAATPAVDLVVDACPSIDEARLRALVDIELGAIASTPANDAGVASEARLRCAGDVVTIELRRGARASRAEVDLASTPEATRLRVLALTITEELALDAKTNAAHAMSSPPPETAAVPTVAIAPTPSAPRPDWQLSARASARRAARPALWLAGAGVGLERALTSRLGIAIDLLAESGETSTALATIAMRDLVASAGLSLRAGAGRWSARAVPAFNVGLARLAATPSDAAATGSSVSATWAGPSLAARGQCAVSQDLFLLAEAAAGFTTRRVTGLVDGQTPLFELRGPWLTLGLGAGATF
jgi:hypothetical protein